MNNKKKARLVWTNEENELLKQIYSHSTNTELLELFPRFNNKQIRYKARSFKLEKLDDVKQKDKQYNIDRMIGDSAWTDEERKLMKENYELMGAQGMAKLLPHRTVAAISSESVRLGLNTKQEAIWQLKNLTVSDTDVFSIDVSFERVDR